MGSSSFEITIEQAWKLFENQNGKCALTGDDLTFQKNKENIASLDRIDNLNGYVVNNLRWVRSDINMMRKNMDDKSFIKLCKKISDFNR